MSAKNIITEWTPFDGFNIMDFRDFQSFPQLENPPFVFKFRFSSIQEPLVLKGVVIDMTGWNIPECKTKTLFSKIQVSKNGFQDVYLNKSGGKSGKNHLTLPFDRDMKLLSPQDVLLMSLFPMCPVSMVDVERILFLTDGGSNPTPKPTPPPDIIDNDDAEDTNKPPPFNKYWYIYATIFGMIVMLLLSVLLTAMRQPRTRAPYIVIRTEK